jgi:hypothetical protein
MAIACAYRKGRTVSRATLSARRITGPKKSYKLVSHLRTANNKRKECEVEISWMKRDNTRKISARQ